MSSVSAGLLQGFTELWAVAMLRESDTAVLLQGLSDWGLFLFCREFNRCRV